MAPGHWFDRLAEPHTRRSSLKGMAAGLLGAAAGATLPGALAPESAQAAESPIACRKGCLWVADQIWSDGVVDCSVLGGFQHTLGNAIHWTLTANPLVIPIANMIWAGQSQRCMDSYAGEYAKASAPCLSNFCPGFDPKAGKHAPCACAPGDFCYPCAASDNGYLCCIYPPGDCHGDCCSVGTCA
ncbi:MAG TPA: hypothetical protein VHZ54_06760 [Solirubrobacterales bacterium]|jgi:hypothetical protein|nr:hypothetical protein [Solirubrobacterales bacterium]